MNKSTSSIRTTEAGFYSHFRANSKVGVSAPHRGWSPKDNQKAFDARLKPCSSTVLDTAPVELPWKRPAAGIIFHENGLSLEAVSQDAPKRGEFEELAMPLFDSLYNFARWLTQNREEAEDLVQDTYVKALKGFSSFQAGTNFRAWMFRILRNSFLNSRTGLAARMTVGIEPEEEENIAGADRHTPETILLERISHEAVAEAIEQLPVHYREVLLLCDVEELKYQEIAETLSLPVGTVMSRLSRARKAVRECLEKQSGVKSGSPPERGAAVKSR